MVASTASISTRTRLAVELQALVIDYKSGSPPRDFKNTLQPYLYPWMVSKLLDADPLGFLYVSIRQNAHEGALAREIAGIAPEGVRLDWTSEAHRALRRAQEAIRGIEAGEWARIGERCPQWCGHRLLSETGVRA